MRSTLPHSQDIRPLALRSAVRAILEKPLGFDWTVRGLGMLRLYLPGPDNLRLHIWDASLSVPDVSEIHTHPWDFTSYVVAGTIRSTRWTEGEGEAYSKQSLLCGAGGCVLGEAQSVRLHPRPQEAHEAGMTYSQRADEIHSSAPEDGTVSILFRALPPGRSADHAVVYYREGEAWVSAEPRPATQEEVLGTTTRSLERWFESGREAANG